jgi:hypothetical protein
MYGSRPYSEEIEMCKTKKHLLTEEEIKELKRKREFLFNIKENQKDVLRALKKNKENNIENEID